MALIITNKISFWRQQKVPNFIDNVKNIIKYLTYLFEAKTEKERETYFENKVGRNSRNVG